jgi:hypothetical protein
LALKPIQAQAIDIIHQQVKNKPLRCTSLKEKCLIYNAQKLTPNPPWSTAVAEVIIQLAQYYLFLFEPQVTKQWFCSVAPTPKKSVHLYTDQRVKRKDARLAGCDLRA